MANKNKKYKRSIEDAGMKIGAPYYDTDGTLTHVPEVLEFYKSIKKNCPETIFHGTDVGHQYETTGERYLNNLERIGAVDSKEYNLLKKI